MKEFENKMETNYHSIGFVDGDELKDRLLHSVLSLAA